MPRLSTLIIGTCLMKYIDQTNVVTFEHIKMLGLKNLGMTIDHLESFLRVMPSLTRLQLNGNGNFLDGHRWEKFIAKHLPLLNKFQFCFNENRVKQWDFPDMQSIIESFRTIFWLNTKRWFVTCEYNLYSPKSIQLYSNSLDESSLKTKFKSKTISVTTFKATKAYNDSFITIVYDRIFFNFTKLTLNDQQEISNYSLFRKMKRLGLKFGADRPTIDWISFISKCVDLTTIARIIMTDSVIFNNHSDIFVDIKRFLRQVCKINSLVIHDSSTNKSFSMTANIIRSIIPCHVRYLTVPMKNLDEIKILLERQTNLTCIKFFINQTQCLNDFNQWLNTKTNDMSYEIENGSLTVWIKKNHKIESSEITVSNKRMKLSDDRYD
ncbi:hypothetical protein I4U23_003837 [Adineta vaga]|nr:hypothetical protein I4U23_003837 [Adineta vaga]